MRRFIVMATAAVLLGIPAAATAAPELSTDDQLKTRRYVSAGDRAYVSGFQDGRFYAQGWHVTGEMGGVWSQPLKLVDGIWFGVGDDWLAPATTFTSGWGYTRMRFPDTAGLQVSRTEFAPDGVRGVLFGLKLRNPGGAAVTVPVKADVHSEVMSHYPWAWTTPNAGEFNLEDTGSFENNTLLFHDTGTPHPNAGPHDWAAAVGSTPAPSAGEAGPGHWGSQTEPVLCTGEDQFFCDEGPFGKGTGGQLRYEITVPAGGERTVWVAVAGSDQGADAARAQLSAALADPDAALAAKQAAREKAARLLQGDAAQRRAPPGGHRLGQAEHPRPHAARRPPADPRRQRGQGLSRHRPAPCRMSASSAPAIRTIRGSSPPTPSTRPSLPWRPGSSRGSPSMHAPCATSRRSSTATPARSCTRSSQTDRCTSAASKHAGNTDETAKFPSLVALLWRWTGDNALRRDLYPFAVRNMRYVVEQLDADGDGWPEGLGNVERPGMGDEKLDNAVYTIRGLFDLADMARAAERRGDAGVGGREGARPAASLRGRLVVRAGAASTPTRSSIRATCSPSRSTGSARRRWRPSSP